MSDHAKRLAEIEALAAEAAKEPWHKHDGEVCSRFGGVLQVTDVGEPEDVARAVAADEALPWLLTEHRAASEALAAAGIPADDRALAERVKALAERTTPKRCDDCGGFDAPHGHRFGCGMEPENEPSTGLDVATAGDAKPMRTDGPIVQRTAVAESEDL